MTNLMVGDIKLAYISEGTGFPVILIHGYGGNKEFWYPQISELSKLYNTIAFDLRGTGESDRPNIPYSMEMLVGDLKGLMKALGVSKAHVIGRSFGGMIAQNFILKYPKLVDKLVLIATNYGKPTTEWVEQIKKSNLERVKLLKENPYQAFIGEARLVFHIKFRRVMERNPKKKFYKQFSMEDLINSSTINPSNPQDVINQAEAMKDHYTFDKLSEIKHQTLLIAASHDRLIPLSVMKKMNELLLNSKLEIINESGHFMTLSRAPEVNRVILDFLKN